MTSLHFAAGVPLLENSHGCVSKLIRLLVGVCDSSFFSYCFSFACAHYKLCFRCNTVQAINTVSIQGKQKRKNKTEALQLQQKKKEKKVSLFILRTYDSMYSILYHKNHEKSI